MLYQSLRPPLAQTSTQAWTSFVQTLFFFTCRLASFQRQTKIKERLSCITCSNSAVSTVRPVISCILWLTLSITGSSSPSSHALRKQTHSLKSTDIYLSCICTCKSSKQVHRLEIMDTGDADYKAWSSLSLKDWLNDLPFWYSVVGCGQDSCFGVTDSRSGKL